MELSEEQIELAAQNFAKCFPNSGVGYLPISDAVTVANGLRAAAPFLQLPWNAPTDNELVRIGSRLSFETRGAINAAIRSFVHMRNAALIPKPVDPIKELILKGIRNNRPWPLDLEGELKLADEIKTAISAPSPPGPRITFTGFKSLDSIDSDHMYRDWVLSRPAPPREEFKKNPADMPQPVDPRRKAIAETPVLAVGVTSREALADRILAALDEVK